MSVALIGDEAPVIAAVLALDELSSYSSCAGWLLLHHRVVSLVGPA